MNEDCLTPKVLEADCDNTPITFLTTEIEGVDDTVTPPQNGAYRNTIVKYLMTSHVYMYNSVGIPTLMNEGIVDDELSLTSVNPVQNKVITKALNDEAEARETKDNELQQNIENVNDNLTTAINNEVNAREAADTALEAKIDTKVDKVDGKGLSTNDYTNADKEIVDGLENKLDQSLVNNIAISASTSTDVLVLEDGKVNPWTGATTTQEVPLPVASSTSAGVVNAATYNTVANNSTNITNILHGTVAINDLSATPTQEELTAQWKAASGVTDLINGARIRDVDNSLDWTYYSNLNEWVSVAAGGETVSVNQWTNNAAGIVKGSEEPGQIYAEPDGTGSVNGWDTVKSDIANNASNLTTLSATVTGKQDALVSGSNIKTINNESILGEGNLEIDTSPRTVSCPITYHSEMEPSPIPFNIIIIDTITVPDDFLDSFELGKEFYISLDKGTLVKTSGYITSDTKVTIGGTEYQILVDAPTTTSGVATPVDRQISIFFGRIYKVRLTDTSGSNAVQLLGIENDSTSQNLYSTTEQAIGTWIDGKTIYRKVVTGKTTAGTTNTIDTGILSNQLGEILPMTCGLILNSIGNQWSFPGSDGQYSYRLEFNKGTSTVNIEVRHTAGAWNNGTAKITVYYTKLD